MSNQQKIITGQTHFPDKPQFYAYLASADANVTGDGTVYRLGTITALTKVYDNLVNLNTNGIFTCSVAGQYAFNMGMSFFDLTSAHVDCSILITTTAQTFRLWRYNPFVFGVSAAQSSQNVCGTIRAPMAVNDTAIVTIQVSNGAKSIDLSGAADARCWFSGELINAA
jgi:hypothetical protein